MSRLFLRMFDQFFKHLPFSVSCGGFANISLASIVLITALNACSGGGTSGTGIVESDSSGTNTTETVMAQCGQVLDSEGNPQPNLRLEKYDGTVALTTNEEGSFEIPVATEPTDASEQVSSQSNSETSSELSPESSAESDTDNAETGTSAGADINSQELTASSEDGTIIASEDVNVMMEPCTNNPDPVEGEPTTIDPNLAAQ